jgi:hypothetical protein
MSRDAVTPPQHINVTVVVSFQPNIAPFFRLNLSTVTIPAKTICDVIWTVGGGVTFDNTAGIKWKANAPNGAQPHRVSATEWRVTINNFDHHHSTIDRYQYSINVWDTVLGKQYEFTDDPEVVNDPTP